MKSLQTLLNDPSLIPKITQELEELEKNPINGWSTVHVNLYNFLHTLTRELCEKLKCSMPDIFIDFHGIQKHQASTHLMTNKTIQLHIGVSFMRKFLLFPSLEELPVKSQMFSWVLAHELGHLRDSRFHWYGSSYRIRIFVNQIISTLFVLGVLKVIAPGLLPGISPLLLPISSACWVVQKVFYTFLHRSFEYAADQDSLRCFDSFDPKVAHDALIEMTGDIKKEIENAASTQPFLLGFITQAITTWKTFGYHPSITKRVNYLTYYSKNRISNENKD